MAFKETKKAIDEIRNRNEVLFRMAISHLMDVGIRNLDDDSVQECCDEIMKEDDDMYFISKEFKCELVRTAAELANFDHIKLLVYIGKYVKYDV